MGLSETTTCGPEVAGDSPRNSEIFVQEAKVGMGGRVGRAGWGSAVQEAAQDSEI